MDFLLLNEAQFGGAMSNLGSLAPEPSELQPFQASP